MYGLYTVEGIKKCSYCLHILHTVHMHCTYNYSVKPLFFSWILCPFHSELFFLNSVLLTFPSLSLLSSFQSQCFRTSPVPAFMKSHPPKFTVSDPHTSDCRPPACPNLVSLVSALWISHFPWKTVSWVCLDGVFDIMWISTPTQQNITKPTQNLARSCNASLKNVLD